MATVAMMLGGAVLNATTFIGASYLAKYFSGDDASIEKKRHDKALEKYQKDYAKYQENREKLLDWQEQNRENNAIASQNFEDTDEAFKLYNLTHQDKINITKPVFSDYYRPSKDQKFYEMIYVGGGMALVSFVAARFLISKDYVFVLKIHNLQWILTLKRRILLTLELIIQVMMKLVK